MKSLATFPQSLLFLFKKNSTDAIHITPFQTAATAAEAAVQTIIWLPCPVRKNQRNESFVGEKELKSARWWSGCRPLPNCDKRVNPTPPNTSPKSTAPESTPRHRGSYDTSIKFNEIIENLLFSPLPPPLSRLLHVGWFHQFYAFWGWRVWSFGGWGEFEKIQYVGQPPVYWMIFFIVLRSMRRN